MQKMLWGCAVAALALLGVGYLAWDYVCGHPDSWLGRGLCHAGHVVATQVKTMEASRHTAELAFKGMHGLLSHGTGPACQDDGKCPAEPALDDCPVEPAVLPGAVVMHDDDDVLRSKPMPPIDDLVGGQPVVGGGEECEEAVMPAVPEDAATMPGCDEDCGRPCPKKGAEPPAALPGCHDDKSAVPARRFDGDPVPQCHPGSEESEPAFPKMDRDGGEQPMHPDVDTMEVRPGDLWFLDLTGPF